MQDIRSLTPFMYAIHHQTAQEVWYLRVINSPWNPTNFQEPPQYFHFHLSLPRQPAMAPWAGNVSQPPLKAQLVPMTDSLNSIRPKPRFSNTTISPVSPKRMSPPPCNVYVFWDGNRLPAVALKIGQVTLWKNNTLISDLYTELDQRSCLSR